MGYNIKASKDLGLCAYVLDDLEAYVNEGLIVTLSKNSDGYYEVFVQETADGTRTLYHGASKESVERAILNTELIDLYK